MMKSLCLLVVCILQSGIVYGMASSQGDVYALACGSSLLQYDKTNSISAGGGEIGGEVCVMINDNPVAFHSVGGTFMEINQYLKNGTNTVFLSGISNKSVYMKIGILRKGIFQNLVLRDVFTPERVKNNEKMYFFVNIDYELPIFKPESKLPSMLSSELVMSFLENYKARLEAQDYVATAKIQLAGNAYCMTHAYGKDIEEVDMQKQEYLRFLKTSNPKFEMPSDKDVKMIRGDSLMLVYSDEQDGPFREKTLGKHLCNGGMTLPAPMLRLAYINKKLVVWP